MQNQWELHNAKYYNHPDNSHVSKKNKDRYIRQAQIMNKSTEDFQKFIGEYHNQSEDVEQKLFSATKKADFKVQSTNQSYNPYENDNINSNLDSISMTSSYEKVNTNLNAS